MSEQFSTASLRNSLLSYEAADNPVAGFTPGTKYMYEHFYLPMLQERIVRFGDIDFTRFNIDDIVEIERLHDNSKKERWRLNSMYEKLYKADAVSRPTVFI